MFTNERPNLSHVGKLKIIRTKDKEWGQIEVDTKVWESRRQKHLVVPELWSKPSYPPHISVFTAEEVKKLPKDFEWEDKEIQFKLSDSVRILNPEGWDEVYECAFEPVTCDRIAQIRTQLGFTPLMYARHEFHLTLAIRYEKDREKYEKSTRFV